MEIMGIAKGLMNVVECAREFERSIAQLNNITNKETMKKFSIDIKASGKKEMKKARKYLRGKGFEVQKRKDAQQTLYLSNINGRGVLGNYRYYNNLAKDEITLTLPQDWDKLVEIVEGEKKPLVSEFKIGDWVKWTGYNPEVGRIQSKATYESCWVISDTADSCHEGYLRPATPAEIKETLIKEAEKRGFKKGVKFVSPGGMNHGYSYTCGCLYHEEDDLLRDSVGYWIYRRGQWAEVIEDEAPEINGYKLEELNSKQIKFGCAEFYKYDLIKLHQSISRFRGNRSISSITLSSGVTITTEQLNEIINYINK